MRARKVAGGFIAMQCTLKVFRSSAIVEKAEGGWAGAEDRMTGNRETRSPRRAEGEDAAGAAPSRMSEAEWNSTCAIAVQLAEQSALWMLRQRALIERRKASAPAVLEQ
jgi:hypothetical protein